MIEFTTCDLYDRFGDAARVPELVFHDFGGRVRFTGAVATIRCFEDNSRLKEASAQDGRGRVLVIDGGGSGRCALMGDMIALEAVRNGWAGVIIHGYVRDRLALAAVDLGVKALGATPRKSVRRGEGEMGAILQFGGVSWRSGDIVFADPDGVIILTTQQADQIG